MAKPVQVNVQDGNLGLQGGSNANIALVMGCSLGGTPATLYNINDPVTATNTLLGGEGYEALQYVLKNSPGATLLYMPLNPSTRGGVGSVTHTGAGALAITASIAPQGTITITCTTGGTLGTAIFTFGVTNPITGVTTTSAPVTSAAGWSSTGYAIPGTYCTWTATAGTYVNTDVYSISTLGVVTHPAGTGPAVGTQTSSPVDYYNVLVTVTLGGAVGTSQFTYSLDNGNVTSAIITSAASYAIPNTGIVLGFSGSATAGDTYAFSSAGPTFAGGDLATALTALETTLIAQATYSLVGVFGSVASAAAWATQVGSLESAALTLNSTNIYPRFFAGGPTVGTVLPNAGSITVDASDTDSVVITARAGMSAPHVCACAGDAPITSPATGLKLRRNAVFGAFQRAVKNVASQDIGAYADGGLPTTATPFRDDFANGLSFFNAGITSYQTYGAGSPAFINRGLMGTVATSDYSVLTNSRVIDQGSNIAVAAAKNYILARLPTQTRNGIAGTIREDAAQKIEARITSALVAGLNIGNPVTGLAVAAFCTVGRSNNIYSSGQLILSVSIQPFSYPTAVVVNIGFTLSAP